MLYISFPEEDRLSYSTTPVLVWATKDPDKEKEEQVIANHERFRKLPFESKYKLGFQHTPKIIKKIGEDFNLDPLKMASIARAVRNFYFGDLSREKIADFLSKEMEIPLEQAQKITSLVSQKIIDAPVSKEVSEQVVEVPLLDALGKYQRLSEQAVSEDRIVVKGESAPVRGSIRNWLRNYRDALGIRKHSPMERGQFLFQSENTKRLSAAERDRLSLVLRSLDENTPVSIDIDRQEILFPAFEEKPKNAPMSFGAPVLETSFRSLEKFPAAQAPIRKALEWDTQESRSFSPPFNHAPEPPVSAPIVSPVENMSFSSSHTLPSEQEDRRGRVEKSAESETQKKSGAISVIKPQGNHFGFRDGAPRGGSIPEDDVDAPRVVDLRNQRKS